MKRIVKFIAIAVAGLAALAYGISFVWPAYDWDLRLSSPDGRYDLIVLRGDAAAFTDFSYKIYIFPRDTSPEERVKGTSVLFTSIWRNNEHLIYSGYNLPMVRWTGTHSVEINLNDAEIQEFSIEPVKRFAPSVDPVLVSVVFGKESKAYTLP